MQTVFSLANRIALVTGSSRGLGLAIATGLAEAGARVILHGRDPDRLAQTAAGFPNLAGTMAFDVSDTAATKAAFAEIARDHGRLDILVHNAGTLGKLTPVGHIQPKDWAEVVAVHMTASWRLIRTCDPLLRQAPAGRAVFVTESRAREPRAYWGAMGATKAGMEHLVLTWAQELTNTPLRVNLFDPGPVATRMRLNAFPGEDRSALPLPEAVAPALAALCLPSEQRHAMLAVADQAAPATV
jgi:NAD(P)-dependent dehydrogenase (short-subunit alcohol dehydrogenase family)